MDNSRWAAHLATTPRVAPPSEGRQSPGRSPRVWTAEGSIGPTQRIPGMEDHIVAGDQGPSCSGSTVSCLGSAILRDPGTPVASFASQTRQQFEWRPRHSGGSFVSPSRTSEDHPQVDGIPHASSYTPQVTRSPPSKSNNSVNTTEVAAREWLKSAIGNASSKEREVSSGRSLVSSASTIQSQAAGNVRSVRVCATPPPRTRQTLVSHPNFLPLQQPAATQGPLALPSPRSSWVACFTAGSVVPPSPLSGAASPVPRLRPEQAVDYASRVAPFQAGSVVLRGPPQLQPPPQPQPQQPQQAESDEAPAASAAEPPATVVTYSGPAMERSSAVRRNH